MRRQPLSVVIFVVLASFAGASTAAAQDQSSRPTITAQRLQPGERILLDGVLDEDVWVRIAPTGNFIQQDPDLGAAATEQTEVRIAFDAGSLYLGITCHDSRPDAITGYQRRRDEALDADDRFQWIIDTYLDGRTGYFFEINPSGMMGDELLSGAVGNRMWDGIWTASVHRHHTGWSAEIEIPFRTLNFDPSAIGWGINFQRSVRRLNEESLWTGHARNQGLRRMTSAGLLLGIAGVNQGRGLDFKPYGLVSAISSPGRGQPAVQRDAQAGFDLFYSVTPGLRANLTVNTDFAQTEVDARQVNLTRFSLLFPEKRDFFVEGSSFFDFASVTSEGPDALVNPFFSRRVGLSPDGEPQKIDFGAKITGQIGRQDIGILHVRTGREGEAPGEDFTVARLRRRLFAQSYVGALVTRRDARAAGSDPLQTLGVDFNFATTTFRGSENLEFYGYYLQAANPQTRGGEGSYGLVLGYPNDPWNWELSFREVQENFDPAIGFVGRFPYRRYNPQAGYSIRPSNHEWIRRVGMQARLVVLTDLDNRTLEREINLDFLELDLHSQDLFTATFVRRFEYLDRDFNIHDDITLPVGSEYEGNRIRLGTQTANNRLLALAAHVELGDFYSGTNSEYGTDLILRARPGVIVYSGAQWNQIVLPEGEFRTALYRVTPELQFTQWISLVNTFQYDTVSRLFGWQSRFRWILRPGNDLFFVYTRNVMSTLRGPLETLDSRGALKGTYTYRF